MKILKRILLLSISTFLLASLTSPVQAEGELVNPLLTQINSEAGLVINPVPTEVALGAKFSLSGTIDPVKKGVTILRQTKKGDKWSTIGSTKTKADGTWSMSTTAPVKKAKTTYRIVINNKDKVKSDKSKEEKRKEGKSPSGGLNAKGRASAKKQGMNLKPPQPEGGSRKDSFCARMGGMKKRLTSAKTARDPDSRINKALRKWNCE